VNYFDQIYFGAKSDFKMLLGGLDFGSDDLIKKSLFKRNVEIVNLELSYKCNRKCDYCPVKDSSRQVVQRFMPIDLLEKISSELSAIRYSNRILLNLYNEPLLDASLEQKIALIKRYLPICHLSFNSNGDKLSRQRLKTLSDSGCDYICVTLHPPAGKEQTISTIRRRLVKLSERLDYYLPDDVDLSKINHFEFRSMGVLIRVQWPNWRISGTYRGGALNDHASVSFVRTKPCEEPFREFTIYYDGVVQPCCESFRDDNIEGVPMGDVRTSTVFDIYSSPIMSKFRRSVFCFGSKKGICRSCSAGDYSQESERVLRDEILSEVMSEVPLGITE